MFIIENRGVTEGLKGDMKTYIDLQNKVLNGELQTVYPEVYGMKSSSIMALGGDQILMRGHVLHVIVRYQLIYVVNGNMYPMPNPIQQASEFDIETGSIRTKLKGNLYTTLLNHKKQNGSLKITAGELEEFLVNNKMMYENSKGLVVPAPAAVPVSIIANMAGEKARTDF